MSSLMGIKKESSTVKSVPKKKSRPLLNFWQIWNLNFAFLGIQFGFGLQNANMSRIFETLGANIDQLPLLWIAAPTTGLLVQPIIGHFSDRTWLGWLGRRRPYFLLGAILSTLALFVMPNVTMLWMAAMMLWVLDASINISMEPLRAFVGDMLPSEQRTKGFCLQSFFIGIGAVTASALPWIFSNVFQVENTASSGMIPESVKLSFYLGGFVYLIAVLWTVFTTKEYSPEQMRSYQDEVDEQKGSSNSWLSTIIHDLLNMPKAMRQLALVQFLTWFALFSMWIYTTSAVTSHIYGTTDTTSPLYNEGANWVGVCFAIYNGVAAILSFLLAPMARLTSRKFVHGFSLMLGGLGLFSIYFMNDPHLLLISMVGVGLAWASILAMPYAMLADALPGNKMGIYMGIFNFFIVIPQICAGTFWGFLTKYLFDGHTIYSLMAGGISMMLAGLCVALVQDKK